MLARDPLLAAHARGRAPRGGAAPRARAPRSCADSLAGMWSNWSRGQSCAPAEHVRPASRAELSEAVARGRAVRVAGAGHSFSGVVPTDGTLLSLDRLDRVLDVDRDSRPRPRRGRHPPAPARRASCTPTASRSRTSATSTPSRSPARSSPARTGRARSSATSPASVEAMELVLADGSRADASTAGDELRAARVGLGALGVVAAVTLRCVPAFRLHAVDRPLPLDDVLGDARRPRRRQRPLRAVHVPALADRADPHQQPHRRAAHAAAGRAREWLQRRRARQPRVRAPQPRRARASRGRSRASTGSPAAAPRSASGSTVLRRLRQPAARALRGDGVRAAARARRRGDARRARDPRAPPGLVPDRAALLGRRRRAALARARARDRVRRGPRVRGHGLRARRSARSRP